MQIIKILTFLLFHPTASYTVTGDKMDFISRIIKGIFIGAGAILPGISSGVLCVIFGIYDKLVNSVLGIFKDFKQNFLFLLPLCIGGFFGVILFGKMLTYVFATYPMQTGFTCIGLILGCVPTLLRQANVLGFRLSYVGYLLLAFLLGYGMFYFENHVQSILAPNGFSIFYLVLCGFFMAMGVVMPGVSSTVILSTLGIYDTYLASVSTLYLPVLIPMGIGLALGCVICLLCIQFLLKHYYSQTFYTIIGFTLGSIFVLYPGFAWNTTGLVSIVFFLLAFYLASKLEKTTPT